jgi:hypothetical protein
MRRAAAVLAVVLALAGCGHSDDGTHVRDDERPASSVPSDTDD